jgi:hypothetical protein
MGVEGERLANNSQLRSKSIELSCDRRVRMSGPSDAVEAETIDDYTASTSSHAEEDQFLRKRARG